MSEFGDLRPGPRYPVIEDLPDPIREGDPRLNDPRLPLQHDHDYARTVYWNGVAWVTRRDVRNFVSPVTNDPSEDFTPNPGDTWDVVEG